MKRKIIFPVKSTRRKLFRNGNFLNSFGHIREVLRFLDQHHPRRRLLQITDEAIIWQDGTDLLEAKLVNEND